jgi:hypothetical protein
LTLPRREAHLSLDPPGNREEDDMVTRVMDVALGLWLCVSAFLWPHGLPQFLNATVIGAAIAIDAAMALAGHERARIGNRALAVWLFVSNLLMPHTSLATAWNHALVAVLVFLLSMVPTVHAGRHARPAPI